MNRIILASHGSMSAGIHDTAEMILGKIPNLYHVATLREETENVTSQTERILSSFDPDDQVYILTDVFGGSVNNDMMAISARYPQVTLICGMNLCLVLSLASEDDPLSEEEVQEIMENSQKQIMNCSKMMREAVDEEEDDL